MSNINISSKSGGDKSGSYKSGGDKSGSYKSGGDKSGSDKSGEHELVKIMAQVTKDTTRPVSNKFETILFNFDKIKAIQNERKLTKSEQSIYEKVHRYVDREFGAMFKRAEPMVNELRKRASVQRGGEGEKDETGEQSKPVKVVKDETSEQSKPVKVVNDETGEQSKPVKDETSKPVKDVKDVKDETSADNVVADTADSNDEKGVEIPTEEKMDKPVEDATAKADETTTATTSSSKKETPWAENFRFLLWIWDGIKTIFDKIISFFTITIDDKMRALMKYFSVENLVSMLGDNLEQIKGLQAGIAEQIMQFQKTVVGGISGAATASIDMMLNAFSMIPVLGTTVLIWRMFQNMLVIMGATLSVQAGKEAVSGFMAKATGANAEDAMKKDKEAASMKPGNGNGLNAIKDEHRTTSDDDASGPAAVPGPAAVAAVKGPAAGATALPAAGATAVPAVKGGSRLNSKGPTKRQLATLKKRTTTNFKRSLKRFVELRPALLVTRGGGGLSSAKRAVMTGSKYAAASGLFSGYAAL
jgi:hypothetical protein